MLTAVIRTIIIYVILLIAMRIMGKRQLGELEVSELITTLLLSEIAAAPIGDERIPLINAIIPIALVIIFEVTLSWSMIHIPKMRNLLSSRPSVLIYNGKIDIRQLKKSRMSVDELVSSLRLKDVTSITDVDCAVLESNGQLSVVQKQSSGGASPVMFLIISDGELCRHSLDLIGRNRQWLDSNLKKYKADIKDIFCFMADRSGEIFLQKKQ